MVIIWYVHLYLLDQLARRDPFALPLSQLMNTKSVHIRNERSTSKGERDRETDRHAWINIAFQLLNASNDNVQVLYVHGSGVQIIIDLPPPTPPF